MAELLRFCSINWKCGAAPYKTDSGFLSARESGGGTPMNMHSVREK